MVDLDTAALQIGYTVLAGTAGLFTFSALSLLFPNETKSLALSSVFAVAKGTAAIQKQYVNHVEPTVKTYSSLIKRLLKSSKIEPRIQLFLEGELVDAVENINALYELDIDTGDYDMILYKFLDDEKSPMLKFDYIDEVTDEFAFSDVKFINVTLTINNTEYTMNLNEPLNFMILDNVILDREFIDWWCINRLGFSELPDSYTVTVIDHNADTHTLSENDALRIVESGFDLLEKNSSNCPSSASLVDEENREQELDDESNNNLTDKKNEDGDEATKTEEEKSGKKSGWFGWR